MTTEELDGAAILTAAMDELARRGIKTGEGEKAFVYFSELAKACDRIKEKIEAQRKLLTSNPKVEDNNDKEKEKKNVDTNPKPELATSATPTRVASREDLENMIKAQTQLYKLHDSDIQGINEALTELQNEIKGISDRLKALEQEHKAQ